MTSNVNSFNKIFDNFNILDIFNNLNIPDSLRSHVDSLFNTKMDRLIDRWAQLPTPLTTPDIWAHHIIPQTETPREAMKFLSLCRSLCGVTKRIFWSNLFKRHLSEICQRMSKSRVINDDGTDAKKADGTDDKKVKLNYKILGGLVYTTSLLGTEAIEKEKKADRNKNISQL